MLKIQKTKRTHKITGRKPDGSIEEIPDLLCTRKHVINKAGWKEIRKAQRLFAFVSSPHIYKQKELRDKVKGWCHGFSKKRIRKNLPERTPEILLPESDFLDSDIVYYKECKKRPKYDYFYFTVNSMAGVQNKGLHVFLEALPILCKHKLKGLVIIYYPNFPTRRDFRSICLNKRQKQILRQHELYLKLYWGLLKDDESMNKAMCSCKFGFFPNTVDNSPRIISETLIRDRPILVNKKIHGGWHYVCKETGSLFDIENLDSAIDFMMSHDFYPREYYNKYYGFRRSSAQLAKFLNPIFHFDQEYTHMYFSCFSEYLEKIRD